MIAAYAIDRRIIKEEISKGVAKAIKGELKEALQGLPSWVPDRVLGFVTIIYYLPLSWICLLALISQFRQPSPPVSQTAQGAQAD